MPDHHHHHHSAKECKSCHLPITDGQAYKLGTDQWHVDCFKCSKCDKPLGVDSNFLVLGTGALVCSDCSYTCKACSKKIYDLAILTGDLAYCADCFKCKSCSKPIDDLKYARTSKGLFCMPCHNMLMEKKKKYEKLKKLKAARENSLKKQREQQEKREKEIAAAIKGSAGLESEESDFVDVKIGLINSSFSPKIEIPVTSTEIATIAEQSNIVSEIPKKQKVDDDGISTNVEPIKHENCHEECEVKQPNISYDSNKSSTSEFNLDDYAGDTSESKDASRSSVDSGNELGSDIILKAKETTTVDALVDYHTGSPETVKFQQTPILNRDEIDDKKAFFTPVAIDIKSPRNDSNGFSYLHNDDPDSDMVIPLRSPRRSNLSPIRNTAQYRTPELETPRKKNNASDLLSPASLNRKAHIMDNDDTEKEPESFINLDETEEESLMSRESIQEEDNTKLLSPIKYNINVFETCKDESAGLNIKGLGNKSYSNNLIHNDYQLDDDPVPGSDFDKTPVQTERDTFDENATPKVEKKKQMGGLGRSLTKVLRRGRKQSDDEHTETPATPDPNISRKSSALHSSVTPKAHNRTQSDHSFKSFTTPPVPNLSKHNRSVSETSRTDGTPQNHEPVSQSQKELQMLKAEINALILTKATILKDIQTLSSQKKLLDLDIFDKQQLLKELDNTVQLKQQQRQLSSADDISMSNKSTSSTKNSNRDDFDSRKMSSSDNMLYEESTQIQYLQKSQPASLPTSTSTQSNLSSQFNQTTPSLNKEKRPNFMKKLFGSSNPNSAISNTYNKPLASGKSAISQPMNVRVNEDSLMYSTGKVSIDTGSSAPNTAGSGIKPSRSTNFMQWRNGSGQGGKADSAAPLNVPGIVDSQLYGLTLQGLADNEGGNGIPFIIQTCIAEVGRRGLQTEGIYRISASTSAVEKLELLFEKLDIHDGNDVGKMISIISSGDIHALAGLLKRYLKKIPDSIIPQSVYDTYVGISKLDSDQVKMDELAQLVNSLPRSNRVTLLALTNHLNLVAENEKWNKMNCASLATVFAPTLVRHDSLHPSQEIQDTKAKTVVTELLFKNYELVFNKFGTAV